MTNSSVLPPRSQYHGCVGRRRRHSCVTRKLHYLGHGRDEAGGRRPAKSASRQRCRAAKLDWGTGAQRASGGREVVSHGSSTSPQAGREAAHLLRSLRPSWGGRCSGKGGGDGRSCWTANGRGSGDGAGVCAAEAKKGVSPANYSVVRPPRNSPRPRSCLLGADSLRGNLGQCAKSCKKIGWGNGALFTEQYFPSPPSPFSFDSPSTSRATPSAPRWCTPRHSPGKLSHNAERGRPSHPTMRNRVRGLCAMWNGWAGRSVAR